METISQSRIKENSLLKKEDDLDHSISETLAGSHQLHPSWSNMTVSDYPELPEVTLLLSVFHKLKLVFIDRLSLSRDRRTKHWKLENLLPTIPSRIQGAYLVASNNDFVPNSVIKDLTSISTKVVKEVYFDGFLFTPGSFSKLLHAFSHVKNFTFRLNSVMPPYDDIKIDDKAKFVINHMSI